ncbi:transcriptional regulator, partial [Arthrospira sp. O9.13F]
MPEISRFFGMVITMYYNDHAPPHFHVRYGQQKALITIETLTLLEGQ